MNKVFSAAALAGVLMTGTAWAQTQEVPRPEQGRSTEHSGHTGQSQQTGHSSQRHQGGQVTQIQRENTPPAQRTAPARDADAASPARADCDHLSGSSRQACLDRQAGEDDAPATQPRRNDRT